MSNVLAGNLSSIGNCRGEPPARPYELCFLVGEPPARPYELRILAGESPPRPYELCFLVGESPARPYELCILAGESPPRPYELCFLAGDPMGRPYKLRDNGRRASRANRAGGRRAAARARPRRLIADCRPLASQRCRPGGLVRWRSARCTWRRHRHPTRRRSPLGSSR